MVYEWLLEAWYDCDRYMSVEETSETDISDYHLFVLDVMLPGVDGFSFGKEIRKHSEAGIIFLTAKSWLDDKIEWFDLGGDDYLTKPFKMKELIARIDALSTRLEPTHYITIWDVSLDRKARSIRKHNELVHLTPTEWELVWFLLKNRWSVCRRADIIEYIWWGDQVYEMSRSLDVAVANIRKKLGKEFITTLPWVWYQLWMKV